MYREQVLDNYYMVKSASKGARERRANNFLSFLPASRTGLPIKNLPKGRLQTLSKEDALENYYLVKEGNVFANLGAKATNLTNKALKPLKNIQIGGPGSHPIGKYLDKPGMTLGQKARTVKAHIQNNPQFLRNAGNQLIMKPAYNVANAVNTSKYKPVIEEAFQTAAGAF